MKYFTIQELCSSKTAKRLNIDNTPDSEAEDCLAALINNVLDPLREAYGKPIIVDSGYRCALLNNVVGGAPSSQHKFGQAADIRTIEDTPEENKKLFDIALNLNLPYDQLIDEYGYNWIHISYGPKMRKQVLRIK